MERSTGEILLGPPKSRAGRRIVGIPHAIIPALSVLPARLVSRAFTSIIFGTCNTFAAASSAMLRDLRDLMARMGHDSERAALIYQHESHGADHAIAEAIDRQLRSGRGMTRTTMAAQAPYSRPANGTRG